MGCFRSNESIWALKKGLAKEFIKKKMEEGANRILRNSVTRRAETRID